MSEFKFIHAADVHIDSPLKGLEAYEGAPVERIRSATREAFENLITLAIEESVAFVLIAGDLFDGKWPDMSTGLWTVRQFRRLKREGIDVYLIRGNHDAANEVGQRIRWPENVHELSCSAPETVTRQEQSVAIHGQGFANREVAEDLAATYPEALGGHFNIGMLHTSLTGDPQHDPYAPTSEDTLKLKGYDYWALGHIHLRKTVQEEPFIGYSGNVQGRHIHERGPKGCLLVSVADNHVGAVEFRATDVLRWELVEIELTATDTLHELYDTVQAEFRQLSQNADGRFSAVRIVVSGATAAHSKLITKSGHEEAVAQIRSLAGETDDIWVEKIQFKTTAAVDVEQLKRGHDLMGDLLRGIDDLIDGDDNRLQEFASALAPLANKATLELQHADVSLDDPDRIREWLTEAEGMLVSMLLDDQSET